MAWLVVGTGWANSCLGCTNVVRKRYSQLVGASFLVVEAVWAQNGPLLTETADYCKFVNEAWLRSQVCVLCCKWLE